MQRRDLRRKSQGREEEREVRGKGKEREASRVQRHWVDRTSRGFPLSVLVPGFVSVSGERARLWTGDRREGREEK